MVVLWGAGEGLFCCCCCDRSAKDQAFDKRSAKKPSWPQWNAVVGMGPWGWGNLLVEHLVTGTPWS